MRKNIKIDSKTVCVEANASTLLIYEDRFKGRRLLQDISELAKITDIDKIPLSLYSKLLWATAKTADETTSDVYEWTKNFTINGIIKAGQIALEMICESIETTKKRKAPVGRVLTFLRTKFSRLRQQAD